MAALLMLGVGLTTSALALGTQTHAVVNREAARLSATFNEYLRHSLGFGDGSATFLRQGSDRRPIEEWLAEGGVREDDLLRFLRHFHDPLQPWDAAGLDFVIDRHDSSVRWMQHPSQGGVSTGGFWAWRDARRLYYQALIESHPLRREALWADLFRALGQIMHLVVDASVPEHTRNDMHPLGTLKLASSYERWVSSQHGVGDTAREAQFVARYLTAPVGFRRDILELSPPAGEHIAIVPVAHLIDGGDPRAPSAAGLAEIANANFFSEDTLRGRYPFPTDAGLIPVKLVTPLGRVRRYFSRPAGQGLLPANPLRAECAAEAFHARGELVQPPPYPCVDAAVWNQVAAHMLPRAVGYARGVLDYFFRGAATITNVEWTPTGISLTLTNTGAEDMEGVFEIYARHNAGAASERRVKLATLGNGQPILIEPGDEWTFSDAIRVPPDAVPTPAHVLVFRGRIGLEEDAVAGSIFVVPYVEVRQTGYEADVTPACSRLPPRSTPPPYKTGVTTSILSESMRCEWRIVTHRVSGRLETNMPVDPVTHHREPIIERIEAQWIGGDVTGPAPLALDGRAVGEVWQRQGTEPDPTTYEIVDPTDRSRSYLYLLISYKNGGQLEAQQAIFTRGTSSHGKTIWLDNANPKAPRYLVSSGRGFTDVLAYNWAIEGQMLRPLFEPLAIGGKPVPTDTRSFRPFGGIRIGEGLRIDAESYSDSVNDRFEIFTSRQAADALYAAIEPLQGPHPEGPFFAWVAELQRLYQPMEREFLRAFVTANPAPFQVHLTAQELGP